MSVRSERWQEEEVGGGVEGDLQEANISLPRLVSRQTANIPPRRRNNRLLPRSSLWWNHLWRSQGKPADGEQLLGANRKTPGRED